MVKIAIVAAILLGLAVVMTMTGRGGGNFYVLTLVLAGVPMHEAATTGQFILFTSALAASLIFYRYRVVSVPLALFIGFPTAGMALVGGFLAHSFSGVTLKLLFSSLLVVAGVLMLYPIRERARPLDKGIGYWHLNVGDEVYVINLWWVAPIALATGFCAGMVGVSGGSFLVPLMVLGCGVPMRVAVERLRPWWRRQRAPVSWVTHFKGISILRGLCHLRQPPLWAVS